MGTVPICFTQKNQNGSTTMKYKPEDIMEQNGKQVESVGEYLCGIYDNRVKRKEAVTLADLCYAWENERSILWIPKAP